MEAELRSAERLGEVTNETPRTTLECTPTARFTNETPRTTLECTPTARFTNETPFGDEPQDAHVWTPLYGSAPPVRG